MAKVSYASIIGSLMYVMVCIRPDITHVVGVVSKYMNNPRKQYWQAVKWILKYLNGNVESILCFRKSNLGLQGYVDTNMASNINDRKSTTRYVYTLGGTIVNWMLKLERIVTISTTEVQYVVVIEARKEMMWLQSFLEELGHKYE